MSLCCLGGVLRARRKASSARRATSSVWSCFRCLLVMSKSPHPPFDASKMEIESAKLRDAIAAMTIAWSHLESTLSLLLMRILRDGSGLASAIYYSPASADVRIKIVDSALNIVAQSSPEHRRIMDCWRHTMSRINRAKAMRNTVAHSVIGYSSTPTRWHVRLTSAPYDFRRNVPADKRRQLPGMSRNDIIQATTATGETSSEVGEFLLIVDSVAALDWRTLRKTLLELEDRRSTEPPQKGVRKPPKQKRPP